MPVGTRTHDTPSYTSRTIGGDDKTSTFPANYSTALAAADSLAFPAGGLKTTNTIEELRKVVNQMGIDSQVEFANVQASVTQNDSDLSQIDTNLTEITTDMVAIAVDLDQKAWNTITLTAGEGLSGTGDLSADRTFALVEPTTTTLGGVKSANSATGTAHIKVESGGTMTVLPDAITLGTHTTGNYVADVNAGTGITVTGADAESSTKVVTISDTAVTPAAYGTSSGTNQVDVSVPTFTVNQQGQLTAASTITTRSANNSTITLQAGTGLREGGNFTTNYHTTKTIRFEHDTPSSVAGNTTLSVSDSDADYHLKKVIDSISFDNFGHVTAITTGDLTYGLDSPLGGYTTDTFDLSVPRQEDFTTLKASLNALIAEKGAELTSNGSKNTLQLPTDVNGTLHVTSGDLKLGSSNQFNASASSGFVGIGTATQAELRRDGSDYGLLLKVAGNFKAEEGIFSTADQNNTPVGESTKIDGYGIMTNREYTYITNANKGSGAAMFLGVGGAHNTNTHLTIKKDGKVGIGTIAPSETLHVASVTKDGVSINGGGDIKADGSITADGDVSVGNKLKHVGDTDTFLEFDSSGNIDIQNEGNRAIYVNSSGNVGIKTNTLGDYNFRVLGSTEITSNLTVGGNLDVTGTVNLAGAALTGSLTDITDITSDGVIKTSNTTDASSKDDTAASINTAGGAAIAKDLFVGVDLDVGDDLVVGDNTTVGGNLTVNGATILGNTTGDLTTIGDNFRFRDNKFSWNHSRNAGSGDTPSGDGFRIYDSSYLPKYAHSNNGDYGRIIHSAAPEGGTGTSSNDYMVFEKTDGNAAKQTDGGFAWVTNVVTNDSPYTKMFARLGYDRFDIWKPVRIGTSTTSNNLEVYGNTTVYGSTILGDSTGDTLTIAGGFTSDTDTLVVDASNDRIGINVAAPTVALDVSGSIKSSSFIYLDVPDNGGTPADAAIIDIDGYEKRGAGIKIQDNKNSASGANNREWFIGSGYLQNSFQIGYAADGVQSSYAAQAKLTISDGGLVGIGTAIPTTKLHVHSGVENGAALFESTDEEVAISLKDSTGTSVIRSRGDFRFDTAGGEKVRIEDSGNVGIGTTSPAHLLHVESAGSSAKINVKSLDDGTASANAGGTCQLESSGNGEAFLHLGGHDVQAKGGDLRLVTATNLRIMEDASTRMYVKSGGNVGIGTTDPSFKLDVAGTGAFQSYLRITENSGNQRIVMGNQNVGGANNPAIINGANGGFIFGHGSTWGTSGGTLTSRMQLDSGGNFTLFGNGNVNNKLIYSNTGSLQLFNVTSAGAATTDVSPGVNDTNLGVSITAVDYSATTGGAYAAISRKNATPLFLNITGHDTEGAANGHSRAISFRRNGVETSSIYSGGGSSTSVWSVYTAATADSPRIYQRFRIDDHGNIYNNSQTIISAEASAMDKSNRPVAALRLRNQIFKDGVTSNVDHIRFENQNGTEYGSIQVNSTGGMVIDSRSEKTIDLKTHGNTQMALRESSIDVFGRLDLGKTNSEGGGFLLEDKFFQNTISQGRPIPGLYDPTYFVDRLAGIYPDKYEMATFTKGTGGDTDSGEINYVGGSGLDAGDFTFVEQTTETGTGTLYTEQHQNESRARIRSLFQGGNNKGGFSFVNPYTTYGTNTDNAFKALRVTWDSLGYAYMEYFIMRHSAGANRFRVIVEGSKDGGTTWATTMDTKDNRTGGLSGWPGTLAVRLNHKTHDSSASWAQGNTLRITVICQFVDRVTNDANSDSPGAFYSSAIYNMSLYAHYPMYPGYELSESGTSGTYRGYYHMAQLSAGNPYVMFNANLADQTKARERITHFNNGGVIIGGGSSGIRGSANYSNMADGNSIQTNLEALPDGGTHSLIVTGTTKTNALITEDDVTVGDDLVVTDDASIGGKLTVSSEGVGFSDGSTLTSAALTVRGKIKKFFEMCPANGGTSAPDYMEHTYFIDQDDNWCTFGGGWAHKDNLKIGPTYQYAEHPATQKQIWLPGTEKADKVYKLCQGAACLTQSGRIYGVGYTQSLGLAYDTGSTTDATADLTVNTHAVHKEFTAAELGYEVGKSGITTALTAGQIVDDRQASRKLSNTRKDNYVRFPMRCGDAFDNADGTPMVKFTEILTGYGGYTTNMGFGAIDDKGIIWASGNANYGWMANGAKDDQYDRNDSYYDQAVYTSGGITKFTGTRRDIMTKRAEIVKNDYYPNHPTLTGADITSEDGGILPSHGKDPYPINPLLDASDNLIPNQNPATATKIMLFTKAHIYGRGDHGTTMGLGTDGKIYMCGYGDKGQLGNNDGLHHQHNHYWTNVKTNSGIVLDNIVDIFAWGYGEYQAFGAIDGNGSVWVWGYAGHSQLGVGDGTQRNYAVKIYDCTDSNKLPTDNVKAKRIISAHQGHDVCHLQYIETDEATPRYYAFGDNSSYMAGAGHTNDFTTPTLMEHGPFVTSLFKIEKFFVDGGYMQQSSDHKTDETGCTMCITTDIADPTKYRLWGGGSAPYGVLGGPSHAHPWGTWSDSGFMDDQESADLQTDGHVRAEYFNEIPVDSRLLPLIDKIYILNNHYPGKHYLGSMGIMHLTDGRAYYSGVCTWGIDGLKSTIDGTDSHMGVGSWTKGVWSAND